MPHWHRHCGCPYHHRGQLCPVCDGPEFRPQTRDEWDEPPRAAPAPSSRQLEDLRDAIERLTERLDALETVEDESTE